MVMDENNNMELIFHLVGNNKNIEKKQPNNMKIPFHLTRNGKKRTIGINIILFCREKISNLF